jgi:hypothetical protein
MHHCVKDEEEVAEIKRGKASIVIHGVNKSTLKQRRTRTRG